MSAPRHLTQRFDDIADGAFITMKNPVWLTAKASTIPTFEGTDAERARKAADWMATLVTEWAIPVLGDDDQVTMRTDVTGEAGLLCPSPMERWILKTLIEGANPP